MGTTLFAFFSPTAQLSPKLIALRRTLITLAINAFAAAVAEAAALFTQNSSLAISAIAYLSLAAAISVFGHGFSHYVSAAGNQPVADEIDATVDKAVSMIENSVDTHGTPVDIAVGVIPKEATQLK